ATSSHGAVRKPPPRQDSGANPIACSTPCSCPPTRSASASRSAADVTSSSITSGVVGRRRAARWVRLIARPNDVSTTSAPASWARCATEKAIDASLSTPVTSTRLSVSSIVVLGSERCVAVAPRGLAVLLGREHVEGLAQHRARLVGSDDGIDQPALG